MHKPRRPRTPRYWPRMKVRGARRRWRAPFDRMARSMDLYGKAFIKVGEQIAAISNIRAIPIKDWAVEWRDPAPRTITAADLDSLGTSIMKEDHGSDSIDAW